MSASYYNSVLECEGPGFTVVAFPCFPHPRPCWLPYLGRSQGGPLYFPATGGRIWGRWVQTSAKNGRCGLRRTWISLDGSSAGNGRQSPKRTKEGYEGYVGGNMGFVVCPSNSYELFSQIQISFWNDPLSVGRTHPSTL